MNDSFDLRRFVLVEPGQHVIRQIAPCIAPRPRVPASAPHTRQSGTGTPPALVVLDPVGQGPCDS